jgi:hypothetical protein
MEVPECIVRTPTLGVAASCDERPRSRRRRCRWRIVQRCRRTIAPRMPKVDDAPLSAAAAIVAPVRELASQKICEGSQSVLCKRRTLAAAATGIPLVAAGDAVQHEREQCRRREERQRTGGGAHVKTAGAVLIFRKEKLCFMCAWVNGPTTDARATDAASEYNLGQGDEYEGSSRLRHCAGPRHSEFKRGELLHACP